MPRRPGDTPAAVTTGQGLIAGFAVHQRRAGLLSSTIANRSTRLALFDDWTQPNGLAAATEGQVESFLDRRQLADRTRYGWISTLHCFYGWGVSKGYLTTDPTEEIRRPKLRRLLPRPVSDEHHAVALRCAGPQMVTWLRLMSFAGLRVSEVATLARDDVLINENRLRILGKGQTERLIPIHHSVATALCFPSLPSRGPIFRRGDGRAFTGERVSQVTGYYLRSVGVDATAHQFRHWFGTKLYIATRDLRLVQELMGHASPITTAGYTAFASAEADGAVGGLPDV